jgi:membrane-bound lytic murein transglycosylase B
MKRVANSTSIAVMLALVGAAAPPAHGQSTAVAGSETSSLPVVRGSASPLPGNGLERLVVELWPAAKAQGVPRTIYDRTLGGLTLDPDILDLLTNQPEHASTLQDYLGQLVSEARVEAGRAKLAELAPVLARIETAFGVDRHVLLAVWGIESNFGAAMGTRSVARSLATLAVGDPRRADYWKKELIALLHVLAKGHVGTDLPTGSWAGAMGHTQFMPTSYAAHAVDFDGDGRRDIWTSVPDALASTANYLRSAGWRAGETWGYEVVLPAGFDFSLSAPGEARSLFEWMETGIAPPPGRKLAPLRTRLRLLLPAGADGPAFLVGRNFRVILRYNSSTAYALAVGHLADRIAGGSPLVATWPDHRALMRGEREELQHLLTARGFDIGGVDGIIGEQTRGAIRAFQRNRGLPADGHPSAELLRLLRGY